MGAKESGAAFLEQVLAKLPDDKRAAAKALFDGAEDAVVLLGDGALARADYSKGMDTLKAKTDELESWFQDNKQALEDYPVIRAEYDKLKTTKPTDPPPPAPPVDPRKVAEDVLSQQGPEYLRATAYLNDMARRHERMFPGEEFDSLAILNDPRLGREIKGQPGRVVSLQDLYNEKYGEKVAAKAKEADEKRFNDEVDKRLKDKLAQHQTNPFPLRGEASVLDVLSEKDGAAKHTIESAVAEYDRLQAART